MAYCSFGFTDDLLAQNDTIPCTLGEGPGEFCSDTGVMVLERGSGHLMLTERYNFAALDQERLGSQPVKSERVTEGNPPFLNATLPLSMVDTPIVGVSDSEREGRSIAPSLNFADTNPTQSVAWPYAKSATRHGRGRAFPLGAIWGSPQPMTGIQLTPK